MSRVLAKLLAAIALLAVVITGRRTTASDLPAADRPPPPPRHVRPERLVLALLAAVAGCSLAFAILFIAGAAIVWLALSSAAAFAALSAAFGVAGSRTAPDEVQTEERTPPPPVTEELELEDELREPIAAVTRRRLLLAGTGALGALGGALIVPVIALAPAGSAKPISDPWRDGDLLVDDRGRPLSAADLVVGGFATAFPHGVDPEVFGAAVVVLRVVESELELPAGRGGWAPQGIVAYSKVCTHAGCAVALFQSPLHPPTSPAPALVCPCHYSTFDVRRGALPVFGPAVRSLPQLPLGIDGQGRLVARGALSGPVGPSYLEVRRT
jgi:ubiquinol-cytochrome c reductase iron-sulfur subunit